MESGSSSAGVRVAVPYVRYVRVTCGDSFSLLGKFASRTSVMRFFLNANVLLNDSNCNQPLPELP